MSNHRAGREDDERAHLDGIEDGAGCVEIWEQLSERRTESGTGVRADD